LGYVNYLAESDSLDNEYDSYTAGFTSSYQLSELWSVSGLFGARYLDSQNTSANGLETTSNSSGLNYSLSFIKQEELDSYSISASRSLLPSSEGDVNQQDAYTLGYSRELTEKLKLNLSTSYREYTSADDISSETTKYIDFSPTLRWKLYEEWSFVFGYRYRSIDESDGKNVNSNSVTFNIDYNWNGIHFSR
jgi:predicted porin